MKRRISKKALRRAEKSIVVGWKDTLASAREASNEKGAESNWSFDVHLTYIVEQHLLLNSTWPSEQRWLDYVSWLSVSGYDDTAIKGFGTLWWGLANNTGGAQVPEPFEARIHLTRQKKWQSLSYSIKFGAGDTAYHFAKSSIGLSHTTKSFDVNITDVFGMTPLMRAADAGNLAIVQSLIAADANMNTKASDSPTALTLAVMFDHVDVVRLLLDNEAEVNIRFNDGTTPLMLAAFYGHIEIVEALLARNADIHAKDKYDRTALEHAMYGESGLMQITSRPYDKIVRLLKET